MSVFVNELDCEYQGVLSLNSLAMHSSASRLAMFSNHLSQSLDVLGSTVKRIYSGTEREYGRYSHMIKMPANGTIYKLIHKYPKTLGNDSLNINPVTCVIYEDDENPGTFGIIELVNYHCSHKHFGWPYIYTEAANRLAPGNLMAKDTILATSPSLTTDGDFKFGLEAQIALMSIPQAIEDGAVASESFCKRMTTKGYGERVVSWGKNALALNLHGTEENYKPYPEIGDLIRDDGLLFALREYDPMRAVVDMTPIALMRPSQFDKTTYAIPGARVIDVQVIKGGLENKTNLPSGTSDQCEKYYDKTYNYHKAILTEYRTLARRYGEHLKLTPPLHTAVREAMGFVGPEETSAKGGRITRKYRDIPVDDWRVTIVFEYDIVPTVGYKLTDCHGGKSVIVAVFPDHMMPVDSSGNRAEIIVDDVSTIKRMNISRLYEQYFHASGRMVTLNVKQMLDTRPSSEIGQIWEYLYGFYEILAPRMLQDLPTTPEGMLQHLEEVAADGVYLYMPTDNPVWYPEAIQKLSQHYPAPYGPVTYTGVSGRSVQTVNNILIGGMYIMLLEKTGNSWAAVSSAKLQHFGIPAKITNADKYAKPVRLQPVRITGESEIRLFAAVCGGDTAAELLDMTNSPTVHQYVVKNILTAPKPTAIAQIVDRSIAPRGQGRVVVLVKHMLEVGGIEFVRGVTT